MSQGKIKKQSQEGAELTSPKKWRLGLSTPEFERALDRFARHWIEQQLRQAAKEAAHSIQKGKDPVQTSAPDFITKADVVVEKEMAKSPDVEETFEPVLPLWAWRSMEGIAILLCIVVVAMTLSFGPGGVPIWLACAALGWIFLLAAHSIYEWWHWVSN